MLTAVLVLSLVHGFGQLQFAPFKGEIVPRQLAERTRDSLKREIPEVEAEGKQIISPRFLPAKVLSHAQAWVNRIVRKEVLLTHLATDSFGLRSSIHKDLVVARYASRTVQVQIVETGVGLNIFIRDASNTFNPKRSDELISTVKAQIARFCNVEESYLKTATAYHGLLSDTITYGGQLAVPGSGVPELEIEWWNRPRFYVVGDVLILSFEERSGKLPTDRGAAGPPVLIPGTPRSPGRFGLIKS
ncbi:MAG TPA: hypothetical protein VJ835_00030 [Fimbriimonadaceae bacterium]|nr:hypothetical protein [Fimbriimonadaceae bacterium]